MAIKVKDKTILHMTSLPLFNGNALRFLFNLRICSNKLDKTTNRMAVAKTKQNKKKYIYIYKIVKGWYCHYLVLQGKTHWYKSSRQLHVQS